VETLVVAAFLVSTVVLFIAGIMFMLLRILVDEPGELPLMRRRLFPSLVAGLLILVAAGFPVIAHDNPKFFPWSFVFSAVMVLAAIRLVLGAKARWAVWLAASLLLVIFGFAKLHGRQ